MFKLFSKHGRRVSWLVVLFSLTATADGNHALMAQPAS